ncbi:MAG: NAD-dependent epimerase/dehydratase family protein, partial [Candidatus Omnitrophica bacterium]|nr:NAD-dependent epimerase/dehydratase family protein [Candidatus Omnitrophota bacterium]
TDEVYGSIKRGSFNEDSILSPSSPYAASKASADLLTLSYYATYKCPIIIARSTNNFGPYQYPEKLIPLFITSTLDGGILPLYGNGLNIRDWIYVKDNCRAIDLVLHNGKIGEIYNIGAGNEITNLALTKLILKDLNKPNSLVRFVKDRAGHDKRYSLKTDKIRALGFEPIYRFKEALHQTITWYRQNRLWWEKIKKRSKEFKSYYNRQYNTTRCI